jgi:transposase
MIRAGFLDAEAKRDLIELARDGSVEHRLGRRANALLLLNNGMSCAAVAKVLFIDDDTVRTWHRLYEEDGIEGLAGFGHEGSSCRLNLEQQDKLKAWIGETLPRSTRQIGTYIEKEFKIAYEGRSGLIALLHRLGMEHRKPQAIPRKLDEAKQKAFIEKYNALLNALPEDEAVMFADAVHPTHTVRPVGCWAPQGVQVAVEQNSGRDRLNIHGAIDLETGKTKMIEALTVDAQSAIMLFIAIMAISCSEHLSENIQSRQRGRVRHHGQINEFLDRPAPKLRPYPIVFSPRFYFRWMRRPVDAQVPEPPARR